jgi:hypothetical protein
VPSINDLIASAAAQIKSNTGTSLQGIKSTAAGALSTGSSSLSSIVPGIVRNSVGSVTSGINQAINVGLKDVTGAASQAISGNFSGALDSLLKGPTDLLGSLGSSFGIGKGSILGSGSSSGADPGNSLAGALARTDPQMAYDWYAIMPDVAPLGGAPVSLPWYYAEEATIPFRTFNVMSIFREGRQRHYPGPYNVDGLRVSLYADTTGAALKYLLAWNGALLSPTTSANQAASGGGYGRAKDYKKSIIIFLLNPAKQQLAKIEYIECWPTTIDAVALESGASTRVQYHVNFSVGDVFVDLYSTAGSTFSALPLALQQTALQEFNITPGTLPIPDLGLPSFT